MVFQATARRRYRTKICTHHPRTGRINFRGIHNRTFVVLMTVVVTVWLLFPPIVTASLLTEIPPDHWSRRVMKHLEEKALISEGLSHFEAETRYDLARRIVQAFQLVQWMAGADVSLPGEPEARAYFTRVQLKLERAEEMLVGRDGAGLGPDRNSVLKENPSEVMTSLKEKMTVLKEEVLAFHRLSDAAESLIDSSASGKLLQALARVDEDIDHLVATLGFGGGPSESLAPGSTLEDVLALWLTLHAQVSSKQTSLDRDSALTALTEDLIALAREFQFEIYALGGSADFLTSAPQTSSGQIVGEKILGKIQASAIEGGAFIGEDIQSGDVQADLDHLREATMSDSVDPNNIPRVSSALLGELRVGTNASVRIGYEIGNKPDDPPMAPTAGEGESLPYNRAGIGFDYKIGERASLSASYSVLNFSILDFLDTDGEDMGSRVGEAKLQVWF